VLLPLDGGPEAAAEAAGPAPDAGAAADGDVGVVGAACPANECAVAGDSDACVKVTAHVLADGQSARAMAIDADWVYWANDIATDAGVINRVPKCGGPITVLVPGGNTFQGDMAMALDQDSVFWLDNVRGAVSRVPREGGSVTTVSTFDAPGSIGGNGMVLDGTSVIWPAGAAANGAIVRAPKTGGDAGLLASGQYGPRGLVRDTANVYWTNNAFPDAGATAGRVNRMPLDGGVVTSLATGEISPYAVAVDATNVYFTTSTEVKRVPITGAAAPTTIASGQNFPGGVAVDATDVYWVNGSTIRRAPVAGGPVVDVAVVELGQAVSLVLDDTSIYWAGIGSSLGPAYRTIGQVGRVSKK
jgi:hypothetical protein